MLLRLNLLEANKRNEANDKADNAENTTKVRDKRKGELLPTRQTCLHTKNTAVQNKKIL